MDWLERCIICRGQADRLMTRVLTVPNPKPYASTKVKQTAPVCDKCYDGSTMQQLKEVADDIRRAIREN